MKLETYPPDLRLPDKAGRAFREIYAEILDFTKYLKQVSSESYLRLMPRRLLRANMSGFKCWREELGKADEWQSWFALVR